MTSLDIKHSVGIFYNVFYFLKFLRERNGEPILTVVAELEDRYDFRIIIGYQCPNCKPQWDITKTWESQTEDSGELIGHITGVYYIKIDNIYLGSGSIQKDKVNYFREDKLELELDQNHPEIRTLDDRLLDLVRKNKPFFRGEANASVPIIPREVLKYIDENSQQPYFRSEV